MFVAVILASNYALAPFANVKLEDTLVFVSAYLYGFPVGASVALLAELGWSTLNPLGFGGAITPFLLACEVLYAVAGSFAARVWGRGGSPLSERNLFFGSLMALCAFAFDFVTNAATGLLTVGTSDVAATVLRFELQGIPFMVPHELSDMVFGSFVAPAVIYFVMRNKGLLTVDAGVAN